VASFGKRLIGLGTKRSLGIIIVGIIEACRESLGTKRNWE
jgi:hypothetical protein